VPALVAAAIHLEERERAVRRVRHPTHALAGASALHGLRRRSAEREGVELEGPVRSEAKASSRPSGASASDETRTTSASAPAEYAPRPAAPGAAAPRAARGAPRAAHPPSATARSAPR